MRLPDLHNFLVLFYFIVYSFNSTFWGIEWFYYLKPQEENWVSLVLVFSVTSDRFNSYICLILLIFCLFYLTLFFIVEKSWESSSGSCFSRSPFSSKNGDYLQSFYTTKISLSQKDLLLIIFSGQYRSLSSFCLLSRCWSSGSLPLADKHLPYLDEK